MDTRMSTARAIAGTPPGSWSLREARARPGWSVTRRTHRISGRVRRALIEEASGGQVSRSDTELLEYALARVALEDEFGARRYGAKAPCRRTWTLGFELERALRSAETTAPRHAARTAA